MYYRFVYNGKNKFSEWHRIRCADFYRTESLVNQLRSGKVEIKDESASPKQLAQRRMWQLAGRLQGLMALEQQLARELRNAFPDHFKNLSTNQVMGTFYTDVTNIDMGLLLKKYCPDLFKPVPPT